MNSTFGYKSLSKATIYNCLREFNCRFRGLSEECIEGRPKSAVISKTSMLCNKWPVFHVVHETYDNIESFLNITRTQVHLSFMFFEIIKRMFALDSIQFQSSSKECVK